jgi:hypothetical protein
MRFFVGLHHPSDARHFGCAFLSVNALRKRKTLKIGDWILDSGAFTEISRHGGYRDSVSAYAAEVERWSSSGRLLAAVSQDYMCEPVIIAKTGLSVLQHQELTIERYDALLEEIQRRGCSVPILPVLQGYAPEDYVRHVEMYGARLAPDQWVGVGSVCKRNGSLDSILDVLGAISDAAPQLKLHGFGLKTNALRAPVVRALLYSADSMAWSFHARKQGRDANDPAEASRWAASFGVDSEGLTRETWHTIGVDEADDWQTPRDAWGVVEPRAELQRRARPRVGSPQLELKLAAREAA